MLNAHDCVFVVDEIDELLDVGEVEEVAVDEHGPALVVGEVRGEEAGEGELGALEGNSFSPVEAGLSEI